MGGLSRIEAEASPDLAGASKSWPIPTESNRRNLAGFLKTSFELLISKTCIILSNVR